ncbi:MAG: SagB/ThcOx family dehydrogenase [Candidatus Omnitrophica bacterium]|nr:SagB/ThcOx family dehydrogenase [Candidatus Omnitrophota bacterium]
MFFYSKTPRAVLVFLVVACFLADTIGFADDLAPIKLSKPQITAGKPLMQALSERKSSRAFKAKELPFDVLSNLLWAAFGINRPESGKRTAPSAMNMQEIDIYVATKDGLYLYNPQANTLEPVSKGDIRDHTGEQDFTGKAPVSLVYVADFSKMGSLSAEDRAFYSAADAAFISQNVYLFCSSEGLSTVVLGWVDKLRLRGIMKLRGNQRIIFTQPVGYPE